MQLVGASKGLRHHIVSSSPRFTSQLTPEWGVPELGKLVLVDYPKYVTRELNENFMGLIIGMPGKGKTWAAARIAERIDPTFTIDRVCISYKEFLQVMKQLANEWEQSGSVAGKVVIFDEFQQSASARKWQSQVNTAINDVLHTFRFMNLIVIFTTPHVSFVDINARAVMHFSITMKRKYVEKGLSVGKLNFTEIKNNPHDPSDKLYSFAPMVFDADGVVKVREVFFEKPSRPMQLAIDHKINAFKMSVLDKAIAKAEKMETQAKEVTRTPAEQMREYAKDIFEQGVRYKDPQTGKWDKGALMLDYPEVTASKLRPILKMVEALERRGA